MDFRPERIMLLKIPIDIIKPEDLPDLIFGMIQQEKSSHISSNEHSARKDIVLLSLWDLLRARRNTEYRDYLFKAVLVIPISKSIVTGAKFLTRKKVYRYMPFNFVISLLSILEKLEYPLYLLGSGGKILKKAEKNIRSTFPRLKIVGRFEGRIRKHEEAAVIEAIRKSSPSLLLAGKGIRGEEFWIARNTERLNLGFRLWCSDLFDVFAEKKRRPSDTVFNKGLECLGYCAKNPLKTLRIFPYIRYKILLLYYRLFKN